MVKKKQVLWSVLTVTILLCVTFASATTTQQKASNATQNSIISYSVFSPSFASIRQPAEFEPMQGALIRYSFGISYDIIKEMAEDVNVVTIVASVSERNTVQSQYQSHGIDLSHCSYLIAPTDSYWTRDYGPWFIINNNSEQGVVDFTYNRPRPDDDLIPVAYASNQSLPLYTMPLETAGGNYMTDGQGIAISTSLVWEENPGLSHAEINQMVHDYLGIQTYHVVPDVNGEYIKHIDCWGKYLSPDTILIRSVPSSDSQYDEIEAAVHYFENQTSCYGTPYHVVRVYTPTDQPYTNSFILNDKVFVPIMGDQWDDDAIASYQNAMPGYEVLGFTGSWVSSDAIHCRVMGITDRYMLYIEHTPLTGNQSSQDGYDIQAKIYPYSGENLIAASTGVYWRIDNQSWNFIQMQPVGDDYYHAVIPAQENGTTVSYYIHAEDASGRAENHPYIGAPDAHSFTAYGGGETNTPPETPQRPSGQVSGKIGTTYLYSTQTTDADGDQVYYLWDWDDGNFSEWLGPFASGATATAQHSWTTKGTYSIRVKAKDVQGDESNWSDPLVVTMPRNQIVMFYFFEKMERWFPHIFLFFNEIFSRFEV
ncbi:MAG: agmatine deiminase family protein [Thermoplasmata archaeon]|nr:agmatine deiminase family protein [Thermoplasmata archaeon]MBE3140964.1 agmatine deiminase family protein [Thermoplasmata archaeon]